MARIEVETRQAINNYERLKFLTIQARDNLREKKTEFDNQVKLCPHYKPDSEIKSDLARVKTWKRKIFK